MQVKDIHKFEKLNNVSVSVYGWRNTTKKEDGFAYPIKVSKDVTKQHIQLLLLEEGDNHHYCWIKNFSRLNGKLGGHHKKVFCRYCLHGYCTHYNINGQQVTYSKEEMAAKLLKHEQNCYVHGEQRIQFPEDDIVSFKNLRYQVEAPFLIYADCESILEKLTINPDANSNKYQHHIACSWCYKIVSNVSDIKYEMRYYFGINALQEFIESLLLDLKDIILPSKRPIYFMYYAI
jgi:hypothetical protein